MKVLANLRKSASLRLDAFLEVAGLVAGAAGSGIAIVFGRGLLAVLLGAVTIGIFLRFSARRKSRVSNEVPLPLWVKPLSMVLTVVEIGLLVEAVDLPVRYSQPGFEIYHWILVILALFSAYYVQFNVLRRVLRRG